MVDPVILTGDGQTYERAAIEQWLQAHSTSPVSCQPLHTMQLRPNLLVKTAISQLMGAG